MTVASAHFYKMHDEGQSIRSDSSEDDNEGVEQVNYWSGVEHEEMKRYVFGEDAFIVPSRYFVKDVIGRGAYGVVW